LSHVHRTILENSILIEFSKINSILKNSCGNFPKYNLKNPKYNLKKIQFDIYHKQERQKKTR